MTALDVERLKGLLKSAAMNDWDEWENFSDDDYGQFAVLASQLDDLTKDAARWRFVRARAYMDALHDNDEGPDRLVAILDKEPVAGPSDVIDEMVDGFIDAARAKEGA